MQKSARILGQDYNLTAEEMNYILKKLGFLVGEPGEYGVTEKGLEYAVEKDYHRGCGGYAQYNRYWSERTFDDSIKEVLEITPELIAEVRSELKARHAAQRAEAALRQAEAEAEYLAREAEKAAEIAAKEKEAEEYLKLIDNIKKTGDICLIILIAAAAGYGIYKAIPRIKKWWENRKKKETEISETEKVNEDATDSENQYDDE